MATAQQRIDALDRFVSEMEKSVGNAIAGGAPIVLFDAETMIATLRAFLNGAPSGGATGAGAQLRSSSVNASIRAGVTFSVTVVGYDSKPGEPTG